MKDLLLIMLAAGLVWLRQEMKPGADLLDGISIAGIGLASVWLLRLLWGRR